MGLLETIKDEWRNYRAEVGGFKITLGATNPNEPRIIRTTFKALAEVCGLDYHIFRNLVLLSREERNIRARIL